MTSTDLFDYELPHAYIAQQPAEPRDSSRLMVLHRTTSTIEHRRFSEITDYLHTGDLLVANDSRVIPARLFGRKSTGGKIEVFLLRSIESTNGQAGTIWECLVRGRGLVENAVVHIEPQETISTTNMPIEARILSVHESGTRVIQFSEPVGPRLDEIGEIPLPPYITEYSGDRERYQTVYSKFDGSAAAPTAGLHFTPELLSKLRSTGVLFDTVTLHVGLDTFRPVSVDTIEDHEIHSEWAELRPEVTQRINQTTLAGGRVVAVGTTSVRTLEWAATRAQGLDPHDSAACPWQRTAAFTGNVDLFIRPGYQFRAVDILLTNFHLPRSSLLMLVSAFVAQAHPDEPDKGRQLLLDAYDIAKRESYRFFSFGDAMLII